MEVEEVLGENRIPVAQRQVEVVMVFIDRTSHIIEHALTGESLDVPVQPGNYLAVSLVAVSHQLLHGTRTSVVERYGVDQIVDRLGQQPHLFVNFATLQVDHGIFGRKIHRLSQKVFGPHRLPDVCLDPGQPHVGTLATGIHPQQLAVIDFGQVVLAHLAKQVAPVFQGQPMVGNQTQGTVQVGQGRLVLPLHRQNLGPQQIGLGQVVFLPAGKIFDGIVYIRQSLLHFALSEIGHGAAVIGPVVLRIGGQLFGINLHHGFHQIVVGSRSRSRNDRQTQ